MAKVSQVNRNIKRERMSARDKTKRAALKSVIMGSRFRGGGAV